MPSLAPAVLAGIDVLLTDMEIFATGSYLRDEEREFWTQPYPVAALQELRTLLEQVCSRIATVESDEEFRVVLRGFEKELYEFNAQYQFAVVEPEEQEEITAIIQRAYEIRRAEFAT